MRYEDFEKIANRFGNVQVQNRISTEQELLQELIDVLNGNFSFTNLFSEGYKTVFIKNRSSSIGEISRSVLSESFPDMKEVHFYFDDRGNHNINVTFM